MPGKVKIAVAVPILLMVSAAMLVPGCAHYKPTTTTAPVQELVLDQDAGRLYIATVSNSRDSSGNPNGGGLGMYDIQTQKITTKSKSSGLAYNNIRDIHYDSASRTAYISYYQAGAYFSIWNTLTDTITNEKVRVAPGEACALAAALPYGNAVLLAGSADRNGHYYVFIDAFDPLNRTYSRLFETLNERSDSAAYGLSAAALINDSIYMGLGPYQDRSTLLRVRLANMTADRHDLEGEIIRISGDLGSGDNAYIGTIKRFYRYDAVNGTVRPSMLSEGVAGVAESGDRMYLLTIGTDQSSVPVKGRSSIRYYDPSNDTSNVIVQDVSEWLQGPFTSLAFDASGGRLFVGGAGVAIYDLATGKHSTKTYSDGLPKEGPGNYGPGFGLAAIAAAVGVAVVLRRRKGRGSRGQGGKSA